MVEFAARPPMAASSHMTRGSSPESQAGKPHVPALAEAHVVDELLELLVRELVRPAPDRAFGPNAPSAALLSQVRKATKLGEGPRTACIRR